MADGSESKTIDQVRLDAGQAILDITDRGGFNANAAAWLHDQSTGAWRYILVTPMLTTNGPKWVYERLLRLFRKFDLPIGISPLDVCVIDDAMEMAAFGRPFLAYNHEKSVPGLRVHITQPVKLDGLLVTDGFAVFLRRLPEATRKTRRNPARRFDKTVEKIAA